MKLKLLFVRSKQCCSFVASIFIRNLHEFTHKMLIKYSLWPHLLLNINRNRMVSAHTHTHTSHTSHTRNSGKNENERRKIGFREVYNVVQLKCALAFFTTHANSYMKQASFHFSTHFIYIQFDSNLKIHIEYTEQSQKIVVLYLI